ncbi:unnamed protein product [Pleuronectes platessa]|uniref:Coiled-coil domain containing 152 n=1 Tax=Pleuronectes platessa TaxID=8262 RepID=A0A9N7VUG1_PLEPL|nr:unnamed protein product [Pleuronectes platessa]
MKKLNCLHLDDLMEEFAQLEQTISQVSSRNQLLEVEQDDATRLVNFYQTKETSLTEERDSLLLTVNSLQQTLQEQCNLRVENQRLKREVVNLKRQNERTLEDGEAEVQQLLGVMLTKEERHKRELEAVRQQSRREAELAQREGSSQVEAKDAEVKNLLQKKDLHLEEMKKRLKDQERERQSELLKLQMEFGAKLARVQSSAQWREQQQQQQQGSSLLPQSVFKRKLQFIQEEKNKEIGFLRQRIKELEESQRCGSISDSRLKRRKI